ncbi:hypothetical protein RB195_019398 [Necator americanus]|uniref:Uncharacterized protein n=1 Tax=Necator americanus TaxID=51031 RepID=A0ABR1CDX9_NECAM
MLATIGFRKKSCQREKAEKVDGARFWQVTKGSGGFRAACSDRATVPQRPASRVVAYLPACLPPPAQPTRNGYGRLYRSRRCIEDSDTEALDLADDPTLGVVTQLAVKSTHFTPSAGYSNKRWLLDYTKSG